MLVVVGGGVVVVGVVRSGAGFCEVGDSSFVKLPGTSGVPVGTVLHRYKGVVGAAVNMGEGVGAV